MPILTHSSYRIQTSAKSHAKSSFQDQQFSFYSDHTRSCHRIGDIEISCPAYQDVVCWVHTQPLCILSTKGFWLVIVESFKSRIYPHPVIYIQSQARNCPFCLVISQLQLRNKFLGFIRGVKDFRKLQFIVNSKTVINWISFLKIY